ncbi:MAG: ABC transporter permease subunit [Chthonomonadales bacterium]
MTAEAHLLRVAFADLCRPKRLVAVATVSMVPALLVLLVRVARPASAMASVRYNFAATFLGFGFVLPILAAVFATGAIRDDMEQKRIPYVLTRPVARWRILAPKFVAAVFAAAAGVALCLASCAVAAWGPAGLRAAPLALDLEIALVGAAVYSAFFLMLAALVKRALLAGLLFAFGWESWVPNMPGSFQKLSLMTYLRVLAPHRLPEAESVDISQLLNALAPQTITPGTAWAAIGWVTALALAVAFISFSTREYLPQEDDS